MATDNETVAEIVNIMRGMIYPVSRCPNLTMRGYADRIEAAHSHDVAELRKCLKEAVEFTCDNCDLQDVDGKCTEGVCPWVRKWRKVLEGTKGEGK